MNRRSLAWCAFGFLCFVGANAAAGMLLFPAERAAIRNNYDGFTKGGRPGFLRRSYFDDGGGEHRYVVFVPYRLQAGIKPPLLVFLHGNSGNGDEGIQHIYECLGPPMWETRDAFPFVVVFPQCVKGSTWGADDIAGKLTLALMEKTQRDYNTDPGRVYLTGVSSGGTGVWSLVSMYPQLFAAAAPVSGAPDFEGSAIGLEDSAKRIADAQLPIWDFYVRGDSERGLEANRRMQIQLLKRGASPLMTEIDGTLSDVWWKHNAWGVAYRNHATYSWLLSHSRSGNAANKGRLFKMIVGREEFSEPNRSAEEGWSVDEAGNLHFDNTTANGRPGVMFYDTTFRGYELHFEVRYEAGRQFELLFPSRDGDNIVIKIALPESGSGGVYDVATQECLQMPSPTAQRAIFQRIWNDVRIRIDGNHLLAEVKGSKLHDLRHDGLLNHTGTFSIKVQPQDASLQWRHFRLREVE